MLTLLAILVYFNIQKRYTEFRKTTIEFIAADIRAVIEKGLSLGLHCSEMEDIPALVDKQSKTASFVKHLSIYSINGNLIYTTGNISDIHHEREYLSTIRDSSSLMFTRSEKSLATTYTPVKNAIGETDAFIITNFEKYSTSEFSSLRSFFSVLILFLTVSITLLSIIPFTRIFKPLHQWVLAFSDNHNESAVNNPSSDEVLRFKEQLKEVHDTLETIGTISSGEGVRS
jgi:hypothetical protein